MAEPHPSHIAERFAAAFANDEIIDEEERLALPSQQETQSPADAPASKGTRSSAAEGTSSAPDDTMPKDWPYFGTVLDTSAYDWLVLQLRVHFALDTTQAAIIQQVRTDLATNLLATSRRLGAAHGCDTVEACFDLDWDLTSFFRDQNYSDRPADALCKVVTLTGSDTHVQAQSCREYLEQVWPQTGPELVAILSDVVATQSGDEIKFKGEIRDRSLALVLFR